MVSHFNTALAVNCLYMTERTGCLTAQLPLAECIGLSNCNAHIPRNLAAE